MLRWRLADAQAVGALPSNALSAEWQLPDAAVASLLATIDAHCDAEEADELSETRAAALERAFVTRHSMRICTATRCVKVCVRRGTGIVHWESPLVAAQRGEGLIRRHTRGLNIGDASMTRVSPIDAQHMIATAVQVAVTQGRPMKEALVIPAPVATAPAQRVDLYEIASRDATAYDAATRALVSQRQRVREGGEEWTRREKLAKLARMSALVDAVRRRQDVGDVLSPADDVLLHSYAQGRREMDAPGEDAGDGSGVTAPPRTADEMMVALMRLRAGADAGTTASAVPPRADEEVYSEADLDGAFADAMHSMRRALNALQDRREQQHEHAHHDGHAHGE